MKLVASFPHCALYLLLQHVYRGTFVSFLVKRCHLPCYLTNICCIFICISILHPLFPITPTCLSFQTWSEMRALLRTTAPPSSPTASALRTPAHANPATIPQRTELSASNVRKYYFGLGHHFIETFGTPFTLILAWISNYLHYKVWDEIIYPLRNFSGATLDVWEIW